jgi:uncharacterized membrane protein
MLMLLLGIILFFGIHSVSVFALPLRDRLAARNELGWKAGYSVVSLAGLILIVIGYGQARLEPTVLYSPPSLLYTIVPVLLLPTFILLVAPYFPGRISARASHPQLIAIKLWAVCHLLVNGNLADVLLFGSFLAWAVVVRISLKRRPLRKVPGAPPSRANDIIAVVLGLGIYALFVFWLHQKWFGMDPLVGI